MGQRRVYLTALVVVVGAQILFRLTIHQARMPEQVVVRVQRLAHLRHSPVRVVFFWLFILIGVMLLRDAVQRCCSEMLFRDAV